MYQLVNEKRKSKNGVEATYVDDEAAGLVATSPKTIDSAIDILLKAFLRVFPIF